MFFLVSKLKNSTHKILNWNNSHLKNIFKENLDIEDKMSELNKEILMKGINNESYQLEIECLLKHEEILAKEQIF